MGPHHTVIAANWANTDSRTLRQGGDTTQFVGCVILLNASLLLQDKEWTFK